ncbi:MAG: hypothetical protein JWN51_1781 [Phycisphaerales bacterium]|jgi:hypothetical protein|nr:hypothetical protein [Phycisphaerales bacterium]
MFSAKRLGRRLMVSAMLSVFLCAVGARADDAPPTQIGVLAVKSLDAIAASAKKLDIGLPAPLTAAGIEQRFAFIGPGGLATDKPLGIIFFGGPGVKADQEITVFVLPVKPTAIPLEALKGLGGQPMPDHPDTVLMNGVGFRRTTDYVIFGPLPSAAALANLDAITDAVKDPGTLARVTLDLKAVRASMPEQYRSLLDTNRQFLLGKAATTEQASAELVIDSIRRTIDKLEKVEWALDSGDAGMRLALTAAPIKLPALEPGNRPGMPPGVIARFDLACPIDALVDAQVLGKIIDAANQDNANRFTSRQKQKLQDIVVRVKGLFFGGDTVSIGLEAGGESQVVYVVNQYAKRIDYISEVRTLMAQAKAFGDEVNEPVDLSLQSYKSGEVQVVRLVVTDKHQTKTYIDAVQQEGGLFIAASKEPFRYIDGLLAAKPEGPRQTLMSGSVELGKLFDTIAKSPGSPAAGMSAAEKKQLSDLFHGQKLGVSISSDGDAATFDVAIPHSLLKYTPKVIATFIGELGSGNPAPKTRQ